MMGIRGRRAGEIQFISVPVRAPECTVFFSFLRAGRGKRAGPTRIQSEGRANLGGRRVFETGLTCFLPDRRRSVGVAPPGMYHRSDLLGM